MTVQTLDCHPGEMSSFVTTGHRIRVTWDVTICTILGRKVL